MDVVSKTETATCEADRCNSVSQVEKQLVNCLHNGENSGGANNWDAKNLMGAMTLHFGVFVDMTFVLSCTLNASSLRLECWWLRAGIGLFSDATSLQTGRPAGVHAIWKTGTGIGIVSLRARCHFTLGCLLEFRSCETDTEIVGTQCRC